MLGEHGDVELIIHHVEDATNVVRLRDDAEDRNKLARMQQLVRPSALVGSGARDGEERYSALLNAIDQSFCTIEVAFNGDNRPVESCFLEISPSFERPAESRPAHLQSYSAPLGR